MVQNDRQRLIVTPTVGRRTFPMSSSKEAPSTTVVFLRDSNLVRVRHSVHYDRFYSGHHYQHQTRVTDHKNRILSPSEDVLVPGAVRSSSVCSVSYFRQCKLKELTVSPEQIKIALHKARPITLTMGMQSLHLTVTHPPFNGTTY